MLKVNWFENNWEILILKYRKFVGKGYILQYINHISCNKWKQWNGVAKIQNWLMALLRLGRSCSSATRRGGMMSSQRATSCDLWHITARPLPPPSNWAARSIICDLSARHVTLSRSLAFSYCNNHLPICLQTRL